MTTENKKKISERPLLIFLIAFFSLALFLSLLAFLGPEKFSNSIGTYYLFGGSIVAIIAFSFIYKGKVNRWDGHDQSKYFSSDEYFKQVRAQEKPFERIIWMVISAAILIAVIGYSLNRFWVG